MSAPQGHAEADLDVRHDGDVRVAIEDVGAKDDDRVHRDDRQVGLLGRVGARGRRRRVGQERERGHLREADRSAQAERADVRDAEGLPVELARELEARRRPEGGRVGVARERRVVVDARDVGGEAQLEVEVLGRLELVASGHEHAGLVVRPRFERQRHRGEGRREARRRDRERSPHEGLRRRAKAR